ENQAEEFREVFYTMEETDVPGWVRSLTLRSIEMPDAMKDEVLLIVNERRKIS
ncbi:MAG: phospholipase, partial [Bacteroidaceae bacterium]